MGLACEARLSLYLIYLPQKVDKILGVILIGRLSILTRTNRRLFSRIMLGLNLPGRYYFLTLTSSPQSPPLIDTYDALRKHLKRERKGCSWIYCMTNEGYGVIHMIIRLNMKQKKIDVKKLREFWVKNHRANEIKIKYVGQRELLASYMADQRKKEKLGGEFAWQSIITRWAWSRGWIPKGFTKEFGRLWIQWMDSPKGIRDKVIYDAIRLKQKEFLNG